MSLTMLSVLPLAAVVTSFVLIALPVLLLMVVWTIVTMARILFPERDLPFDPAVLRERARQRGEAVPVQFRDLLDDQRRAKAPAMPRRVLSGASSTPVVPTELAEDLWLRRN